MRILRGVGSRILPCGCLVGLYETYNGRVIAVIDGCSATCTDPSHRVNAALPATSCFPLQDLVYARVRSDP
jgi:hypothetical protein